ncbi:MAG: amino acid ABC transporter substrate-binding protein [Chlorobium sp.]|nr:MAG: amino acid ABC transporter substrate-binding protein [Chlorobium sp.]
MRFRLILACLLYILASPFTGYGVTPKYDEIKLGALIPLTGDWASKGSGFKAALSIAKDDVNNFQERIGSGHRISMTIMDTETSPSTALAKMKEFSKLGVRLVIAATSSAELAAIKEYADTNGIIVIGTASTAVNLAIPDNIIRLVPNDANQGRAMAELLKIEKMKVLVPIVRGDVWGKGLLKETGRRFGGKVVKGIDYKPGTDLSSAVRTLRGIVKENIARYGSDRVGVYLISFDEAVSLMAQASKDPVLSSVKWFGSDGIANSKTLIDNAAGANFALKTKLVCPAYGVLPGLFIRNMDDYERVNVMITQETGAKPDGYALASYDALWIATQAMILAGTGTPDQLKDAVSNIANRFTGITGPLSVNSVGDRESVTYQFLSVKLFEGTPSWKVTGSFRLGSGGGVLDWKGQTVKMAAEPR